MKLLSRYSSRRFRSVTILAMAAVWITLALNVAFWRKVWIAVDGFNSGNYLFLASLPVFLFAWNFVFLWFLCWRWWLRPALAVLLLMSAAGSYFLWIYGVVIDSSMMMNVFQTDLKEFRELLTPNLIVWMLIFGVAPVAVLFSTNLKYDSARESIIRRSVSLLAALGLAGVVIVTQYQSYASLIRNNREVRLMLVPSSIAGALHSYAKQYIASPKSFEQVGLDAQLSPQEQQAVRKKLLVLVVGETARSMNFSLNGYDRSTNPQMADREVLSFKNVSSCGTATAISVPCLFQEVGRSAWKSDLATRREGLLDVLQRAGVNVLWRDNNSGCKGACDRVGTQDLSHADDPKLCRNGECFDEILLTGLQDYIDKFSRNDSVIVLHMKGSHGPSYFKRYPPAFESFTPVCATSQLDQCSDQSILNSYDNSLLYSDYVLSHLLDILKANAAKVDSAMLYVSDHGESLGEKGVYLHGLPYALAPREQTQVPMVLWMAPELAERREISSSCLQTLVDKPFSHDNVYHSVLGLMGIKTSVYQRNLDIFSLCRVDS